MARHTTHPHATHGSIRAVAARVGIGEKTLRRVIRAGEIPIYRAPGFWPLISVDDVERWLHSHRVEPTARARARVAERLAHEAQREARRTG